MVTLFRESTRIFVITVTPYFSMYLVKDPFRHHYFFTIFFYTIWEQIPELHTNRHNHLVEKVL